MNVCEWLGQVRKLDQLINAKLAERERLMSLATDITPRPLDGMPHSFTGSVSQRVQDTVVKLIMLADETNDLIDQYVDLKQEVVDKLMELPGNEFSVLHKYYVEGMTWEEVANDMGYSNMQIWRIKKRALKILQDVIECDIQSEYNGIVR